MPETIRENPIQKDLIREDPIQNVDQSVEKDDQLPTPERSSQYDTHDTTDHQSESKTPDILQTDLNEDRHQEIRPFDRQKTTNLQTDMKNDRPQRVKNMKEPQSFDRQPPQSFRAPQPFQSAIPRKLFSLPREKRSLFESSRPFNEPSRTFNEPSRPFNESTRPLINPIEPRRHSESDVPRIEIRPPQPSLMNQVDEIPTEQTPLEITDIFERLNIANKIEKAKEIAKEKDKTKEQFKPSEFKPLKPSKPPPSRPIESSDLNPTNIIEDKRNRKPNLKYAQLVYEE